MKKSILWLAILALLMSSCGPAVTSVRVTLSFSGQNETTLLGGKYTQMETGDGFILESVDGMGVYDEWMRDVMQGPFQKVVFRSIMPDTQIQSENVLTVIPDSLVGVWEEREVWIFYNDHAETFGSATEPILTETGIIFWTGSNDDPACEYVSSQNYGDKIAWHCVFDLTGGDGPIAYLYRDGRP